MIFLVGIGSNREPEHNILKAMGHLHKNFTITGISPFYQTAPLLGRIQENYYNGIIRIETGTDLKGCEKKLKEIEDSLGRIRDPEDKYASRVIDLDILAVDNIAVDHKDFTDRPFNLAAAAVLSPNLMIRFPEHPEGVTAMELFKHYNGEMSLKPLHDFARRLQQGEYL